MPARELELWGGVECTVARVGDAFRDQVAETGHRDRPGDLDAIAALGIRTLRYPVVWETIGGGALRAESWSWHDARLSRLRELDIRPIAGLVHHGSGPLDTNLLDPDFPRRLAVHAGRVARRYPWIEDFTPVNEPLTTARFSALYGHWYPHERSYEAFLTALVNQCRATVLAMRAIRRVTPSARLVQTDDLGKTFSTPQLAYQAEHENGRRWLAFDLLCGRVDRSHPWWRILRDHGIAERTLAFFLDGDAAPDVIGVNHYLTSERFLDERVELYPPHLRGGNHRGAYADVEAVRMRLPEHDVGPAARLREAWLRYGRPVAVTEVHHGCTRDEQLRWLADVWNAARTVRAEGGDIRAVTLWSLFGAVDWASLLTERRGIYEPGAFDARGPAPRPTALAGAARQLATAGRFDHPVLDTPGWWHRDSRYYAPSPRKTPAAAGQAARRTVMIAGAAGVLGRAVSRICAVRGLDYVPAVRSDLDIADLRGVEAALERHRAWAFIDLAPVRRSAETDARSAGTRKAVDRSVLAQACASRGIPLVTLSSDQVFDGRLGRPYRESDAASPRGADGRAQAGWDARLAALHPGALTVRTGALFGPWDRANMVWSLLQRLSNGRTVEAAMDPISPTYIPDLAHVMLDLLIDGESGLWHLANPGVVTGHELALDLASRGGFHVGRVMPAPGTAAPSAAALETERGSLLPPLSSALDRFFHDSETRWGEPARLGAAA